MHVSTRQLLKDRHLLITAPLSLLSVTVQAYLLARSIPITNDIFIIRTSQGFGPTQIGSWWELFVPYLICFWLILWNLFLIFIFYDRSKLVARTIMWFTLALSFLLILYTYPQATTTITL